MPSDGKSPSPSRPQPPRRTPRGPQLRTFARFHSRIFRDCRDVVVWTPPGYGAQRRRHPVVYFHDGQNIFDPKTAFAGVSWRAGEIAAELVRARAITPPILVGIGHAGAKRIDEFTPTRAEYDGLDGKKVRSAGDAKRYARFVETELKPFIDARYLTLPGPRTTSLVGSSMGGLVSLYMALWHPRVFGNVAALSPSIWWDDRVALRDFARVKRRPDVRLWVDMGTKEEDWELIQPFRDTLVSAGWTQGVDLEYREVADAEHTEAAWSARLPDVLRFLVGRAR